MAKNRINLTVEQKLRIQQYAEEHKKLTQDQLKRWVKREFQLDIGRSTIGRILQDENVSQYTNRKSKRMRPVKFPDLERRFAEFLESSGADMSTQELQRTATQLRDECGISDRDLAISKAWVYKFKERHGFGPDKKTRGVKFPALEEELLAFVHSHRRNVFLTDDVLRCELLKLRRKHGISARHLNLAQGWLDRFKTRNGLTQQHFYEKEVEVTPCKHYMSELLSKFEPCDIFLMREVPLFFRLLPDKRAFLARNLRPDLREKEFISVVLCCNSDGSEKLDPFVLGKLRQPKCFRSPEFKDLPISYVSEESAWLATDAFMKWLHVLNTQMATKRRTALLLVHSAPNHVSVQLPNVSVQFLPSESRDPMSSILVPEFKAQYKSRYVQWVVDKINTDRRYEKFDLLQSLRYMVEAWQDLTAEFIQQSWLKARIARKDPHFKARKRNPYASRSDDEDEQAGHSSKKVLGASLKNTTWKTPKLMEGETLASRRRKRRLQEDPHNNKFPNSVNVSPFDGGSIALGRNVPVTGFEGQTLSDRTARNTSTSIPPRLLSEDVGGGAFEVDTLQGNPLDTESLDISIGSIDTQPQCIQRGVEQDPPTSPRSNGEQDTQSEDEDELDVGENKAKNGGDHEDEASAPERKTERQEYEEKDKDKEEPLDIKSEAVRRLEAQMQRLNIPDVMDVMEYLDVDEYFAPDLPTSNAVYCPESTHTISHAEALSQMICLRDYFILNRFSKEDCDRFKRILTKVRDRNVAAMDLDTLKPVEEMKFDAEKYQKFTGLLHEIDGGKEGGENCREGGGEDMEVATFAQTAQDVEMDAVVVGDQDPNAVDPNAVDPNAVDPNADRSQSFATVV